MEESGHLGKALDVLLNKVAHSPYWALLGIRIVKCGGGRSVLSMKVENKLLQIHRSVHGGALCSLGDAGATVALLTLTGAEKFIATAQLNINFLAPARGDEVLCYSTVIHLGQRTGVGEFEIKDKEGKLLAKGSATHVVVGSAPGGGSRRKVPEKPLRTQA